MVDFIEFMAQKDGKIKLKQIDKYHFNLSLKIAYINFLGIF